MIHKYFKLAQTPRIFSDLDEWIRHRLRMLQLKQWKRGTTTYRELRARGLDPDAAAQVAANTRRRWFNSHLKLHLALRTSNFDDMGLPKLAG